MAIDTFLKLGALKGESQVKGFEDQIQVLAWSWGMSQSGTTHHGTGGGAGKVNVQDLSFTHFLDASSPSLMLACCKGTHYPEATLTMRKAGGDPLPYLVIKLKDIIITSVSGGGSGGEDQQTENVTMNFAAFEVSYQPQDNKGAKKGGAIEIKYDIAKND
ncbi:type VI secretion system secreted protein Hcp [Povalibacter uvarum]|uniref:Type VI secretion system secreted protein Hcp n=1 Tax=Povalibacter uvarum TaxID=732238 RepID=A0A841HGD9_9GAMM|nr:type VI secretion system tube protein Hcp [Povalibacter uvarum]MBB6091967.1 type VI secretion system secreted protein Hcp [Povalibacter uvarum]